MNLCIDLALFSLIWFGIFIFTVSHIVIVKKKNEWNELKENINSCQYICKELKIEYWKDEVEDSYYLYPKEDVGIRITRRIYERIYIRKNTCIFN